MIQELRRDAQKSNTHPLSVPPPKLSFVPARTDPKAPPTVEPRVKVHESGESKPDAGRFLPPLVVIFALLNAADLISTFVGLHNGLHEGNPLMSALLVKYGFIALVLYKVVVVAAVALGVRMLRSFRVSVANVTIVICDLLVLSVVIANVTQYLIQA